MPGFWYLTAIAAVISITIGLASGLSNETGSHSKPAANDNQQTQASQAVLTSTQSASLIESKRNTRAQQTAQSSLQANAQPADTQNLEQAIALANQAVSAFQSARQDPKASLAYTRRERALWQASLQSLYAIPKSSALHKQAAVKQTQYQQLLATADRKIATANSAFLTQIIADAGVSPDQVHITLCQVDNPIANIQTGPDKLLKLAPSDALVKNQISTQQCRHHQGDTLMASAASLIKLPVAIALLQKASAEDIDLNQKIEIDPANFTENAEGATLEVGNSYPLRSIMQAMIDRSDNIATNQLIDYIGRDRLAEILDDMGYADTYAGHKLVGDLVMPDDMGDRINQSTTNDLTAMLVRTYSLQAPGEKSLLESLKGQTDRELGYQALAGSDAQWLGEKTGQNGRVIGSALAMQVGDERYALTVAIDDSGDAEAVQEIIKGIADYLGDVDGLIARSPT